MMLHVMPLVTLYPKDIALGILSICTILSLVYLVRKTDHGDWWSEGKARNDGPGIPRLWVLAFCAGVLLFAFDRYFKSVSQDPSFHSRNIDHLFMIARAFGMGWEYAVAIFLLVAIGLIYKRHNHIITAGELVTGWIVAGVIAQGFKHFIGRLRPDQSESPFVFFDGGVSFFSGDVVTAITFATIMSTEYPRQNLSFIGIKRQWPVMPILFYSLAISVVFQRLYSNNHWASDVYYGALAAYAVSRAIIRLRRQIRWGKMAAPPIREGAVPADADYRAVPRESIPVRSTETSRK